VVVWIALAGGSGKKKYGGAPSRYHVVNIIASYRVFFLGGWWEEYSCFACCLL